MNEGQNGSTGLIKAVVQPFAMVIASEIGDKTFLIAAVLAMRHSRLLVFAGALGSLIIMSVLSAAMGHLFPTLIPRRYTQAAASVLFLVFGAKMLQEAKKMKSGKEKIQEGMCEAEKDIKGDEAGEEIPLEEVEEGEVRVRPAGEAQARGKGSVVEGVRNFFNLLLGPVLVQTFVLTFLGEWGDRSQIATIAFGAAHNMYLVTIGTIIGHTCCTALAVVGGRYISTRISVKHVTLCGSVLFLLFGIFYLYEAFMTTSDLDMSIPIGLDDSSALT